MYNLIRNSFHEPGVDVIGKIQNNIRSKPWWDDELKNKLKELKNSQKSYRKRSDQSKLDCFLQVKIQFFKLYDQKREKHWETTIQELSGDQTHMWKIIRRNNNIPPIQAVQPIIEDNGTIHHSDEDIANQFTLHYGQNKLKVDNYRAELVKERSIKYCKVIHKKTKMTPLTFP